jgi:hypothetical protein
MSLEVHENLLGMSNQDGERSCQVWSTNQEELVTVIIS